MFAGDAFRSHNTAGATTGCVRGGNVVEQLHARAMARYARTRNGYSAVTSADTVGAGVDAAGRRGGGHFGWWGIYLVNNFYGVAVLPRSGLSRDRPSPLSYITLQRI